MGNKLRILGAAWIVLARRTGAEAASGSTTFRRTESSNAPYLLDTRALKRISSSFVFRPWLGIDSTGGITSTLRGPHREGVAVQELMEHPPPLGETG